MAATVATALDTKAPQIHSPESRVRIHQAGTHRQAREQVGANAPHCGNQSQGVSAGKKGGGTSQLPGPVLMPVGVGVVCQLGLGIALGQ
jgi:hypothetical protein